MHPNELLYSKDNIWCKKEPDGKVRLGMTYYYQEQLKKIVYIDLPKAGAALKRGDVFASFESSKTAADLFIPLSGTIIETNALLLDKPGMINQEPYDSGWILLIKPSHPEELDLLLSAKKYIDLILK